MRELLYPTTEEEWLALRVEDITSTEVSALFGISPYCTEFELWHRKKSQQYVKIDPNERMALGTALQDSIAAYQAKQMGWKIRRMNEYMRIKDKGIGASFDFEIYSEEPNCLMDIKNVDSLVYKKDWIADDQGNPQAPLHIEIQVQHQLLVSGMPTCYLVACVGGNHIKMIERTADPKVHEAIIDKVQKFWDSIENNQEPSPNMDVDAAYINTLYVFAEPGTVVTITDPAIHDSCMFYNYLGLQLKSINDQRESIKAQILMAIGSAEKAIGNGFTIDAGVTGASTRNFIMPAFRRFRVFPKKAK